MPRIGAFLYPPSYLADPPIRSERVRCPWDHVTFTASSEQPECPVCGMCVAEAIEAAASRDTRAAA